ncbi:MAG: radical SAM/SPASM domain-containing protein [Candidatus Sigynarchaeota archaeon]
MLLNRINPFKKIYDQCNLGDPANRYQHPLDFPRFLDIEITNHCNFNCLMCPVGTKVMNRTRGFMDKELYNRIIDEIKAYKTPIRFIRWGEPMLHKEFFNFLKKAKESGIMCHLNTNGSLFTEETLKKIVELGIESIKFSFQGIDKKSYFEMRNRDFFDELMNTVKRLYDLRGEREFPYIHIASTITYESQQQVDAFKDAAKHFADLVTVGRTKMEHIDVKKIRLSEEEKERFTFLKEQESLAKLHFNCCPEVFDKLSINWDGKVTACCGDYDNMMIVGDLRENTLKEIWNSEKLNHYRKLLSQRRYDEIKLCKTCYDTMGIQTSQARSLADSINKTS